MKYKVGDKVKVREDLKEGDMYGEQMVVGNMPELAGKDVTIKKLLPEADSYTIEEKGWNWTDEMFVPSTTNHIPEVAKLLGVEIGEEFDIEGFCYNPYHFTDSGLIDREDDENNEALVSLITGQYPIIKRPFIPKEEERYFYIDEDGDIRPSSNDLDAFDFALIAFGNCFRTKEEAERNKEAILKKMEEYKR